MENIHVFAAGLFAVMPLSEIVSLVISVVAVVLFAIFAVKSIRMKEIAEANAKMLKHVARTLGAGVVEYLPGDKGFILYASERFYNMLGFDEAEFDKAYNGYFYEIMDKEYRELCGKYEIENGEIVVRQEIKVRVRDRGKNDELSFATKWFLLTGNVIKKRSGKETVSAVIVDVTKNHEELEKQRTMLTNKAMRDPMTGAFNKESTKLLVENYMKKYPDRTGMLLLIDIDKFKNVNDTYGHLVGDKVLIRAVKEMQKAFREEDIIGRIGGDEFVVFIGNIRDDSVVIEQAKKLQAVLRTPAEIDDLTIPMSASIGISVFPKHGSTYEALIGCADKAVYKVKGTTRDAFCVYGQEA